MRDYHRQDSAGHHEIIAIVSQVSHVGVMGAAFGAHMLDHARAAVDDDDLASDVSSGIRRQEECRALQIVGTA